MSAFPDGARSHACLSANVQNGATPLVFAVEKHLKEFVSIIVQGDVDVNHANEVRCLRKMLPVSYVP